MNKKPNTEAICKECGKPMRRTWMKMPYGCGYWLITCGNAGRGLGDTTGCFMFGFPFKPDEYETKFEWGKNYRLDCARKSAAKS